VKNERGKIGIITWTMLIAASVCFFYPLYSYVLVADAANSKQDLKNKIEALRSQIEKYQQEIDGKNQKEESVTNNIEILNADIKKIELQVQETELVIGQLSGEIAAKQSEVNDMQKKVDDRKKVLSKFLQDIYERGGNITTGIVFGNQSFSEYFFQAESLESFEGQTKEVLDQLVYLRDNLKRQKDELMKKRQ